MTLNQLLLPCAALSLGLWCGWWETSAAVGVEHSVVGWLMKIQQQHTGSGTWSDGKAVFQKLGRVMEIEDQHS